MKRAGVAVSLAAGSALLRGSRCGSAPSTHTPAASKPGATGKAPARGEPGRAAPAPLHLDRLARFVDALPIPRVLSPDGTRPHPHAPALRLPLYRVAMRETELRIHRDLPPTRAFGYQGSVPGPSFETRSGQGLLVEWSNQLPERHLLPIDHTLCGAGVDQPEARAVVHVHGGRVPSESDGFPMDAYPPGRSSLLYYPSAQDAAMLWYHDHAMGIERLNQYAGLFGVFLVRDAVEDALELPGGAYEIPLVLCDRILDADGQLRYPTSGHPDMPWVPEVYGDAHLINGKLFPYLEVEPRRYRFRVLNAANARFYELSLSDAKTFHQIGSDQGLLPAPVELGRVTLAPAERADLLVDFGDCAGRALTLRNRASELMQFRVAKGPAATGKPLPARLRPLVRTAAAAAVETRTLTLDEYQDPKTHRMLMLLNGSYWHDPISETPALGSVEIWNLVNLTEDTHPIHLHLVRFQVLERQRFDADEHNTSGKLELLGAPIPPAPNEAGWKDTVRAGPGLITRIIVRFEGYAGRYVWHCHVLEHAANEMMRPYEVVAPRG